MAAMINPPLFGMELTTRQQLDIWRRKMSVPVYEAQAEDRKVLDAYKEDWEAKAKHAKENGMPRPKKDPRPVESCTREMFAAAQVTLMLRSGTEVTGMVHAVNDKFVVLNQLKGKEHQRLLEVS